MSKHDCHRIRCWFLLLGATCGTSHAQSPPPTSISEIDGARKGGSTREMPASILPLDDWQRVDESVERALTFLAAQQEPDGSFPTLPQGQPAVTSLCVLAFMAHGHNPGEGPYGDRLTRATDYILSCQKECGVIALLMTDGPQISRGISYDSGGPAAYDHAISSLTLSEIYGMNQSKNAEQIRMVIDKSLAATLAMQRWQKDARHDQGGWRYISYDPRSEDSDLSVTGWELMFLRSARNAGFDVPKQAIDDAVDYVRRTFNKRRGTFVYHIGDEQGPPSRAMAGAGILALGHAGFHNSFEAQSSGKWLSQRSFDNYNDHGGFDRDRYHYSLFNSCQGMYQLGGPYWERFFPRMVHTVLANQRHDGSWEAEQHQGDQVYGNAYSTALVVLTLGAPNQLLPIFQR